MNCVLCVAWLSGAITGPVCLVLGAANCCLNGGERDLAQLERLRPTERAMERKQD